MHISNHLLRSSQEAERQELPDSSNTSGRDIQKILEFLQRGIELSNAEQTALRCYKCAVAELQAYSDTELAELGIARHDIFLTAIDWHTRIDDRNLRSVA